MHTPVQKVLIVCPYLEPILETIRGTIKCAGTLILRPTVPGTGTKASSLGPGILVKLHSLAKAQDLNGLIGVCQSWELATERWIVDVQGKGRFSTQCLLAGGATVMKYSSCFG